MGIKVFTEKPPVISYEQWEDFSAIDTTIGICFQNRYNQNVQRMKKLVEDGTAGKILGARAFVTWTRGKEYYTESGWRGMLKTEGGGALINQSIHTLDLLVYLMGKPIYCDASCKNRHLKGIIEVEDTMEAYVQFKGDNTKEGAAALFYATTAYSTDAAVMVELHCENMTMKAEGDSLTVTTKDGESSVINFPATASPLGKAYWGNGHFMCISKFYQCIEEDKKPEIGISEIADTTKLMLDIYNIARA